MSENDGTQFKHVKNCLIMSIRGTAEFQFAFHSRITQNYIFELTNCRQIIPISLLEEWQ